MKEDIDYSLLSKDLTTSKKPEDGRVINSWTGVWEEDKATFEKLINWQRNRLEHSLAYDDEIKKALPKLVKYFMVKYHPDKYPKYENIKEQIFNLTAQVNELVGSIDRPERRERLSKVFCPAEISMAEFLQSTLNDQMAQRIIVLEEKVAKNEAENKELRASIQNVKIESMARMQEANDLRAEVDEQKAQISV